MAARENQGYLIAVIILVLLTLVLALVSFFGWSKASEYAEGKSSAESSLKVEQKVREAHQIEAEVLRALVGDLGESYAEVPTKLASVNRLANDGSLSDAQKTALQNVVTRINEVKAAYDKDMQQFISKTEEDQTEDLTWSGVLRNLIAVTARKHNELSIRRQQNADEKAQLESEKNAVQERLNVSEQELVKTQTELDNELKRNKAKEEELLNQLTKAKSDIDGLNTRMGSQIAMLEKQNGTLSSDNDRLKTENAELQRIKQELTAENFDIADGKIVGVARNNVVYLNIGSRDGLRTNQTFAVFDKNVNNFEKGEQKAKIEVIRITGTKSADARVTDEDPTNPITRDDLIVTPTWDPGFRVPIAIAGIIDLDGDGVSDRLQFVRMIENNGGKVVAQHDESGKIIGKLDASTRYLVMGDTPKPGPQGDNTDIYGAIRDMEKSADDKSVQIIDLRRMLNRMGRHLTPVYRNNPGIESAGTNGRSSVTSQGSSTR